MPESENILRNRYISTVLFEPVDRAWRHECMGFWDETLTRWHGEGLPAEVNDMATIFVFNGFDWQAPLLFEPDLHPGIYPLFQEEVIREERDTIVKRSRYGTTIQVPKDGHSTPPHVIEAPVSDAASWEEMKSRMDPLSKGRIEEQEYSLQLAEKEDWPLFAYICGLFGTHRHLFGLEPLMYAYYEKSELLHEISRHWVYLWKTILSTVAERRRPDVVYLWEDMCGKNGPIIGPHTFDAFMTPYYQELIAFLRNDLGVSVISVDTDGDCTVLIEKFVDTGVNMLLPFEVQAGMDVLEVRKRWPDQFAIWGGMDKRELAKDKQAIEKEVKRVVPPMLAAGGYIPGIDHLVPPDVSYENWLFYRDLVRDVVDKHYGVKNG
jgi:uroporphyrinogen-III decarboxylase